MNFTKFDITVLIVMSLSVIIMSFAFPALGLTDESNEVNEGEIPQFNASSSTFDMAGDFPTQPTTPSSGVLEFDGTDPNGGNSITGKSVMWIERPKPNGVSIELQNTSQDGFDVQVTNFNESTGNDVYEYNITGEEGQEILHNEDYVITFDVQSVENYGESNMTAEVEWTIEHSPDEAEGISSIPLIGGIADAVANVLGFIAVVITWAVFTFFEITINAIVVVANLAGYLFGMAIWLVTTYQAIISAAPSWAGVVLAVPGVILFAEFAKLAAILIALLPTT